MKYNELDLYPSRFENDYTESDKHLAKWREDVFGPLSILFAMQDLADDKVGYISFAIGGHPTDADGGNIVEIATVGKSPDNAGFIHPFRYLASKDDKLGSYAVPCYKSDPCSNAMVILYAMAKGNIYRIK